MKTIIKAENSKFIPDFKELYKYRDLFITLSWRDFRVRYAQTSIGFLWAFIQPALTIVILNLVFGKFVGVKTETPHIVFTVTGMVMWTYFSYVMTNSGNSIIASQEIVKKIYFPRLIIPLSKAVVGFIDFFITILMLIILMFYFQISPSKNILFAPLFILIGIISALSVGIWLSALSVRFRDFQHVVPFLVQIGLYITPVAYPADFAVKNLPSWATTLYYLNPMTGVIQGFRWSILGGETPNSFIFISFGMVIILFVTSLMYFTKVQDEMADFV